MKDNLLISVQDHLDPLQFAYRPQRGVEDAACTLLNLIHSHLEGANSLVRLLFIDFSSAFNCIQPHILAGTLKSVFNIEPTLICWLINFLTNRSQRVRVNCILSNALFSSTGSPQGCVLSAILFILYTNACQSQHAGRHIIKFADDSVIVSLLTQNDPEHGPVLNVFTEWCKSSFININVTKTKEIIIDFRRNPPSLSPTFICDQAIEVVKQYKYLGITIDDKLTFEQHVDHICKKSQQRMFFYRKLRNFNVDKTFMRMFYCCFIETILSFAFVSWFGSLSLQNKNRLQHIVKVCGKIAHIPLTGLHSLYETRTLKRAQSVLADRICCVGYLRSYVITLRY